MLLDEKKKEYEALCIALKEKICLNVYRSNQKLRQNMSKTKNKFCNLKSISYI